MIRLLQRAKGIRDEKHSENHIWLTYIYNSCDGSDLKFAPGWWGHNFSGNGSELNIGLANGNTSISTRMESMLRRKGEKLSCFLSLNPPRGLDTLSAVNFLYIYYMSGDFKLIIITKLWVKKSPITLLYDNRYALVQSSWTH